MRETWEINSKIRKFIVVILILSFCFVVKKNNFLVKKTTPKEGVVLSEDFCEKHNLTNPTDCILARQMGTTNKTDAINKINQKPKPIFSETADTDEGMFSMNDNYGTSYYYRGAVDNNYVKFAGFYWRILRISGTGNIKLIYHGKTPLEDGRKRYSSDYTRSSVYTRVESGSENVGYIQENNGQESEIKTKVDKWYQENILPSGLSQYIADEGFCGDRSVYSQTKYEKYYGAYGRLKERKAPILTCPRKADFYTVNDTLKGNGKLKYPVALISADEYSVASSPMFNNNAESFLGYFKSSDWTMTPSYYNGARSFMFYIYGYGNLGVRLLESYHAGDYRPVIVLDSLKLANKMTGQGSINNPYEFFGDPLGKSIIMNHNTAKTYEENRNSILEKKVKYDEIVNVDEGLNAISKKNGEFIFYRGKSNKNYVNFAGNTWRILGVNPDNSVKLILNYPISFDNYSNFDMNYNTSNIKKKLDKWYEEKLNIEYSKGKKYSDFIKQEDYCNDLATNNKYKLAYHRIYNNKQPNFGCNNFIATKVALPSIDEIILAGGRPNIINKNYYLYSNYSYWTMSDGVPIATMNLENIDNFIKYDFNIQKIIKEKHYIRPVITLNADVEFKKGNGTSDAPYEIKIGMWSETSSFSDNLIGKETGFFDPFEAFKVISRKTIPKADELTENKEAQLFIAKDNNNVESNIIPPHYISSTDYEEYKKFKSKNYSYFYKGQNANNYVKLAGFYWRIVRITGSGNIKLIYEGRSLAPTNNQPFLKLSKYSGTIDNPQDVGFIHQNKAQDSIIKLELENWYSSHYQLRSLTPYLSDEGFCENKKVAQADSEGNLIFESLNKDNLIPDFTCFDKTSYTLNDDNIATRLTYPVGLITYDELIGATVLNKENKFVSYLNNKNSFWTMTPSNYSNKGAFSVLASNDLSMLNEVDSTEVRGVRPSIVIKNKYITEYTGDGSIDFPYEFTFETNPESQNYTGSFSEQVIKRDAETNDLESAKRVIRYRYGNNPGELRDKEDDYGTSYFFSGVAENNYVKFANLYWRILRVTGNNNVKMIYHGTKIKANLDSETSITGSNPVHFSNPPSSYSSDSKQEQVGYVEERSGRNSLAKTYVDNWYRTNIQNKGFGDLLADDGFCGDRSGLSYGSTGEYAGFNRIYGTGRAILTCPRSMDLYTVLNSKGNRKLTYPVALISVDEASLAGGIKQSPKTNLHYLTNIDEAIWTMTPAEYMTYKTYTYARNFIVQNRRYLNIDNNVYWDAFLRPVIVLDDKKVKVVSGNGKISNPYIIERK